MVSVCVSIFSWRGICLKISSSFFLAAHNSSILLISADFLDKCLLLHLVIVVIGSSCRRITWLLVATASILHNLLLVGCICISLSLARRAPPCIHWLLQVVYFMDIFGRYMIFTTPEMRCGLLAGCFGFDAAHVGWVFGRAIVIWGGWYLPAGLMTLTCFHGRILHIRWLYYLVVLGWGLR